MQTRLALAVGFGEWDAGAADARVGEENIYITMLLLHVTCEGGQGGLGGHVADEGMHPAVGALGCSPF